MEHNITPEQAEELKKKLESMSPEELREFQKKQCIFCHIVSGRTSSRKIYEDDKALAVLDINPANKGHILLLPKEHYSILPQIPEDIVSHLFMVAKALSHSVLRALQCQGSTIFIANGVAAGQKAQHFMIHVIPRFDNDNIGVDLPETEFTKQNIETIRKRLLKKVEEQLHFQPKEEINKIKPKIAEEEPPKEREKKETKPKKEKKKQKEPKPKEEKINLDDIAKVLGV